MNVDIPDEIRSIAEIVCGYALVDDVLSGNNNKNGLMHLRRISIYLVATKTNIPKKDIIRYFGYKKTSYVYDIVSKMTKERMIKKGGKIATMINRCEKKISDIYSLDTVKQTN